MHPGLWQMVIGGGPNFVVTDKAFSLLEICPTPINSIYDNYVSTIFSATTVPRADLAATIAPIPIL